MKKKVLILGSTGMLGHHVANYFLQYEDYEVFDISYRNKYRDETIILDVRQKEKLQNEILSIKPDFIINCIGILISGSNSNISNAIYINAYLPHFLAEISTKIDSKLVHISTDCVFSGMKGKYTESDEKDGKDTYAITKALGEVVDSKNVTLRTSIIGLEIKSHGEGLFHWFMNQTGEINGFSRAIWSGVTTLELAKAIRWAIENEIVGLYHITNNQSINKYELLNLFKKYTKKEITINKIDGKEVDKSFIDTRKEIGYTIPSYDVMVKDMVDEIKLNRDLYIQYIGYLN